MDTILISWFSFTIKVKIISVMDVHCCMMVETLLLSVDPLTWTPPVVQLDAPSTPSDVDLIALDYVERLHTMIFDSSVCVDGHAHSVSHTSKGHGTLWT